MAQTCCIPDEFLKFLAVSSGKSKLEIANFYTDNITKDLAGCCRRYLVILNNEGKVMDELLRVTNGDVKSVDWLNLKCLSVPSSVSLKSLTSYEASIIGVDAASVCAVESLQVERAHKVLDLCCCPGIKLMLIRQFLTENGEVIGVDISGSRMDVTRKLIKKFKFEDSIHLLIADGITFDPLDRSTFITYDKFRQSRKKKKKRPIKDEMDFSRFCLFDRVLVDAECTHDGSLRHISKYGSQWGWETFEERIMDRSRIDNLAELQYGLLLNGFKLLKPQGLLIYSTCSLCPTQNQVIVNRLIREQQKSVQLHPLPFSLKFCPHCGDDTKLKQIPAHPVDLEFGSINDDIPHFHSACLFHPIDRITSGLFLSCLKKVERDDPT